MAEKSSKSAEGDEEEPIDKLTEEEVEQLPLLTSDEDIQLKASSSSNTPPPSFDWNTFQLSSLWTLEMPAAVKLMFGAGGIYAAFMYYGVLLEDIFLYEASDGDKFKQGGGFRYVELPYSYIFMIYSMVSTNS